MGIPHNHHQRGRAIARELGRSPATVSRELHRNVDAKSGAYRPHAAQRLAEQRRARPRAGKLVADVELREFVQGRLKRRWSPEQIAQALRSEFPDQPHGYVVPETIYQAVYRPDLGGLCRNLPEALGSGRLRREPRRRAYERRGRLVNMTMIDQRPEEAAGREVAGHWEGGLITGEFNRSAISTLVERSSRYTILLYLPGRHTAEAVRDAVIDAMKDLPEHLAGHSRGTRVAEGVARRDRPGVGDAGAVSRGYVSRAIRITSSIDRLRTPPPRLLVRPGPLPTRDLPDTCAVP